MDILPVVHRQNRPGCLTLISLFYGVHGALLGVISMFTVGIFTFYIISAPLAAFNQLIDNFSFEWLGLMLLSSGLSIINLALAVFLLAVAFGLWKLKPWAYRAAVTASSIVIALNLIVLVLALATNSSAGIRGLVSHGLILWGLSRDEVKSAFN